MSYWLHEEAESELSAAVAYYAQKASLKIATAFLDEFERVTRLLQSHQDLGTPGDQGMRIYPFRRFPYSVIYRENEVAGPQIYAVAHQNRKPGYWDVRL